MFTSLTVPVSTIIISEPERGIMGIPDNNMRDNGHSSPINDKENDDEATHGNLLWRYLFPG